jgi:multiple sugar transport system permease protein
MRLGLKSLLFILPALLYVGAVLLYPLIYNISLSLHDVTFTSFIKGGSNWIGLQNYWTLRTDSQFIRTLFNTLIFLGGSIFFQFVIGFSLALLFTKRFPLNNFLQGLIMLPWFVPIATSAIVFRWFFADAGLINSFLIGVGLIRTPINWITSSKLAIISVTVANIWLGIPFNFIMLLTGLKAIPGELYECAAIDGAREWQKVVYISLPLLRNVIAATLILGSVLTIKVFDLVWLLTKGGPAGASHLLSTYSYSLAFERFRFGYSAAVILVMILIVVVMMPLLNRIQIE